MTKKLYRSATDKVLLGVCGGIAEYFEVDSVLVRLIFVVIALAGGFGILFYIIAAIIMPEEPQGKKKEKKEDPKKNQKEKIDEFAEKAEAVAEQMSAEAEAKFKNSSGKQVFGFILIVLGFYFMFQMIFPWFNLGNFWWLILIILGISILFSGRR